MSEPLVRKGVKILSPLRYPGAKRRLGAYVAEVIRLNSLTPKLFVEPFAGGASVGLQLLEDGLVENLGLGERDPWVAAFWHVAFNDTEWLVKELKQIPINLETWHKYKAGQFRSRRDRALACIFLNRTSFSGILAHGAGPIGGQKQESAYKIDCRFNRDKLTSRLRKLATLKKKVKFISNTEWKETMAYASKQGYRKQDVFFYLDPPFWAKAEKLYRFYFNNEDHQSLHDSLMVEKSPWLLSYDVATEIVDKYTTNGSTPSRISLLYSTDSGSKLRPMEELIMTNLPSLPVETRMWRTAIEWGKKTSTNKELPPSHS